MRKYAFESKNSGTVEVSVYGSYRGSGCKDVNVCFEGSEGRDFEETDDADEIMQWLVDQGVEFESRRSQAFNLRYIQCVLIDGDVTEQELLDSAAGWTDEDVDDILWGIG